MRLNASKSEVKNMIEIELDISDRLYNIIDSVVSLLIDSSGDILPKIEQLMDEIKKINSK